MPTNRRSYIKNLSAGALISSAPLSTFAYSQHKAPSDQLNIALVGVRGVGWANLRSHLRIPGVNLLALCDVDQRQLDRRLKDAEEMTGKRPLAYTDFRKLYENKDLDAIIIATPDHWHAIQAIQACQAGLDVYVEKPLANSIEECRAIEEAASKYNRIVQVGQQQRSGVHWQRATDYIKAGNIGKVNRVRAWVSGGSIISPKPDTAPPKEVDYQMWLGPAPDRPFNENRFHGTFRYFWDYAGGLMTDWGVHLIDMVLMGMDASAPKSVLAGGGKYVKPDSPADTPDTMNVVYEFDDFLFNWEHNQMHWMGPYDKHHGVEFVSEKGKLIIDRSGWEVFPLTERGENGIQRNKNKKVPFQSKEGDSRDKHAINFVESIKSRKQPICPVEIGSHVAVVSHLGNISYRLGRKIYWDKQSNNIVNDNEAQALARANYHNGWKLSV